MWLIPSVLALLFIGSVFCTHGEYEDRRMRMHGRCTAIEMYMKVKGCLLYDICEGVRKVRCNQDIATDKIKLLAEEAGYDIDRSSVSLRTRLAGNDFLRLAKKHRYYLIKKDLKCFEKAVCSVEISPNGLKTLAEKTRQMKSNVQPFLNDDFDNGDYLGLDSAANLLDALADNFLMKGRHS